MQETEETWVRFLGCQDPLEEGMAAHSSILVWRILWTEEPGRLQSIGSQRVRHNWSNLAQHTALPGKSSELTCWRSWNSGILFEVLGKEVWCFYGISTGKDLLMESFQHPWALCSSLRWTVPWFCRSLPWCHEVAIRPSGCLTIKILNN